MTIWTWDPQQRQFVAGGAEGELRLADSWLVEAGSVRGFERHRRRFSTVALELGCTDADSADFWSAFIDLIPRSGEWFPRAEILGDDEPALGFRLRQAPARADELRVWIPPFADPRQHPRTKGPDIARLAELRWQAHEEHKCDEVLLVNALHGIRRIRAFSGQLNYECAGAPKRFWEWKVWLDAQMALV